MVTVLLHRCSTRWRKCIHWGRTVHCLYNSIRFWNCVCLCLIGFQFVLHETTVSKIDNNLYLHCIHQLFCRYVKNNNPYLNIVIIAGAVIFYATVILFGVDENIASNSTVNGLCQTRVWWSVIGFSLLFGTILAKTWKIYYVFKHTKSGSNTVSGNHISALPWAFYCCTGSQWCVVISNCRSAHWNRYDFHDYVYRSGWLTIRKTTERD